MRKVNKHKDAYYKLRLLLVKRYSRSIIKYRLSSMRRLMPSMDEYHLVILHAGTVVNDLTRNLNEFKPYIPEMYITDSSPLDSLLDLRYKDLSKDIVILKKISKLLDILEPTNSVTPIIFNLNPAAKKLIGDHKRGIKDPLFHNMNLIPEWIDKDLVDTSYTAHARDERFALEA